jgi:hypothetical protein
VNRRRRLSRHLGHPTDTTVFLKQALGDDHYYLLPDLASHDGNDLWENCGPPGPPTTPEIMRLLKPLWTTDEEKEAFFVSSGCTPPAQRSSMSSLR